MDRVIYKAKWVFVVIVVASIIAIGQIIYLQYFTKVDTKDSDRIYRTVETKATRGSILAMDGRPLSTSLPYFQLLMDCSVPSEQLLEKELDSLSIALSALFKNRSAAAYKSEILKARSEGRRYYRLGNREIDYSEMLEVKKFPLFRHGAYRGGIILEEKSKRNNPYGRLAYRTIGFINSEGVGVGLEKSYNWALEGTSGVQTLKRLLGGEWVPVLDGKKIDPKNGSDIVSTINIEFQEAAERALKEQLSLSDRLEGATAVVMEVKTGAIRAMANMKKGKGGQFDESYNYAIAHATEPGSTFKLATLVTLLEDGKMDLNSRVDVGNGTWRYRTATYSDVGTINKPKTLLEAFEKSSNVAFAKATVECYEDDQKRFVDRVMATKITEKLTLDVEGARPAVMYTPKSSMWSKVSLPSMAIGYSTLLTPMHILSFYNAIANGGKMMRPYLVETINRGEVVERKIGPQEVSGSICSKKTVEEVKRALRSVVENGTGSQVNDDRYSISGKTGTSRIAFEGGGYTDSQGYRMHQASFAGFFPSEDPKYSIIVVLYSGKTKGNFYGASWAGPVFKKIADEIYANSIEWVDPVKTAKGKELPKVEERPGNINDRELIASHLGGVRYRKRGADQWLIKDSSGRAEIVTDWSNSQLPDFKGMGLKDALFLLENLGCNVKFEGRGRVVEQTPPPGKRITKGERVVLKLSSNY